MTDGVWTTISQQSTSPSGKTLVWEVNAKDGDRLGTIFWLSRWRQYVFAPKPSTVWNPACLDEVSVFVRTETQKHHRKAKEKT